MRPPATSLALWASLMPLCLGINISPTAMGGLALARVLFGDSRDVFSSSSGYSGDPSAIRSFTDGPFGMGSGIIMSTGSLTSGSLAPGDSYNGASFLLNVLPTKATTLLIDMVIASCDVISGDKVMVFVNGVNVAKDETGTPLDSSSKYLSEPWGIPSPNGDTVFAMSSPPLRFSIPLPKTYVELKIAVCDRHDGYGDTAVMIKARPCTNCDQTFKVDYDTTSIVSTTTYEATSVVTQAASGTVRGTISYLTYVTASATTLFDRSQYLCYLLDGTDGPAANNLYDMATLLSSTSSTAMSSATFSTTTTSTISAPTPCNQLENPSYINGVKLSLLCGKQATGGNQIDYSNQLHSLTECMTLCADTLACRAVTFNNVGNECTLYDGVNNFMSDFNMDMAVVASRPATSSTTEAPTAFSTTTSLSTTSTTAPSGPRSCSQMAGSTYTGPKENKFTLSCDTSSTGESIYRRDEEDSMQGCLDRCDNDSRCIAVNFHPSPYSECDLIESFTGTKPSPGTSFASKVLSSASTSTSSETFVPIESTSESTASTLDTTSSASISIGSPETTSSSSSSELTSETTSAADACESTSQSSSLSRYTQTTSPSSFSSFTTINLGSKTFSASGFSITKTTSQTRLPTSFPTPTAIHTAYSTLIVDHVYTKTQFAETVTTVTYTTINPSNPTALITTFQYPSGWAGGNSNPVVQPTEGPQGGSQHGSKNVPPETPTRATGSRDDSHPSYKVHQPATTTSATGSNGDTQPAQGNTRPSVPAQGSPESNSNTPMNPSQPSSPKSLTTETSTISTPQLDTSAIPSQSSPLHQDQVPSEPADAPYATPMVVSEARGYSLPSWIAITAIVGMDLLL
ncbi:hypothetical protein FOC4_h10016911, partial [Fusarium odoratissimum]